MKEICFKINDEVSGIRFFKASHLANSQKYQSPEIVNEQMGKQVLRSLLNDIKEQPFYAIIADETTDISGKEQLAISLRWVTD